MLGTIEGLPDLTEPDFYLGNPYPAYHRLHREAPVYWHPHRHSKRGGFWLVSGHAPLSWASRHPEAYSSLEGLALDGPDTEMINLMLSGSIICTDPPVHRDFRRLLLDVFKPTAMENLESVIRSHMTELLDRVPVGEPFDLVETVAAPLPTWVVGELLGTPPEERVRLEHLVDAMVADADDFRIDRDPNPHVAMGVGEHYCLGVHLGRLETRIFFEEFFDRFSSFALAGPAPRVRTTHIRGLRSLPLVVEAG